MYTNEYIDYVRINRQKKKGGKEDVGGRWWMRMEWVRRYLVSTTLSLDLISPRNHSSSNLTKHDHRATFTHNVQETKNKIKKYFSKSILK